MNETISPANLEVHPSVLFKLGEDLISDEIQALAELLKNSYDADSTNAIVRVVTTSGPAEFPDDRGYVEVIDDGHGMTESDIRRGWLTVSNSIKYRMKERGETTNAGRTPLGDKGLGRLGAQRLGNRLTITTTPIGKNLTHTVTFDWREFSNYEHLSEIELSIRTSKSRPRTKHGTTILISDLRDARRLEKVSEVQRSLTKVVSPYSGVASFKIRARVNGEDLELDGLEASLRRAAVIHYDLEYNTRDELRIVGRARLSHLVPNTEKDRAEFARICEADEGAALFEFLRENPRAKDLQLRPARNKGWWVEFERTIRLAELQPVLVSPETGEPASPGPFSGEIDVFNLRREVAERVGGFDSFALLRQQVRDLAGVRIYRDGFNVRTPEDWLMLGQGWTSGSSWYGLRPGTTLGYIELSASDNAQLVETTDREGFSRTPHFQNFEQVMQKYVATSHEIQELIGRSWGKFRTEQALPSDPNMPQSPRDLTKKLGETLAAAKSQREALQTTRMNLQSAAESVSDAVNQVVSSGTQLDENVQEMLTSLTEFESEAEVAAIAIKEREEYIGELEKQEHVGVHLQKELDSSEDQLELMYETVGVGLTAESLSHEIANITDRLARRTSQVAKRLSDSGNDDRWIVNFIEHVKGSVAGLRRQIAHLSPALRYVRERRERLVLSKVLQEVQDYFMSRWQNEDLSVILKIEHDVTIKMNRGKIFQVFDNLLLNSEYWLREALRVKKLDRGEVTIVVSGASVNVSDNGLGVDPEIENSLFEPFTTQKPKGKGRGLGLFISTQLLASEGCGIRLGVERNGFNRRCVFVVDLSGAVTL